jgi:hypothetical protein
VTSWETRELTSITEPPVAPLLEPLATETTGVVGAMVVVPMVLMSSSEGP